MQPISVIHTKPVYPQSAPYHPSQAYPEYPFPNHIAGEENAVYDGVRELLHQLGYDKGHYGTKAWNPLGWLIQPGMKVVLKPNFVLNEALEYFHPEAPMTVVDCWRTLDPEKLDKRIRLVALGRSED